MLIRARLLVIAGIMAGTLPVYAGVSTFSQVCSSSNPSFSDCRTGSTASLNWASEVLNPDNSVAFTQHFMGSATSEATSNLWRVNFDVAMTDFLRSNYVWNWNEVSDSEDPRYPGYYSVPTMAYASATTTDQVTVTGGVGVYSLAYVFSLDGSLFTSDDSLASPNFCASLFLPGTPNATFSCLSAGNEVPQTFTISYKNLRMDEPLTASLTISASGILNPLCPDDHTDCGFGPTVSDAGNQQVTMNYAANFGSTVHLQKIVVTDDNGDPIPGLRFLSGNGYDYNVEGAQVASPSAVPEPSTLALAGLSVALAAFGRRRSKNV